MMRARPFFKPNNSDDSESVQKAATKIVPNRVQLVRYPVGSNEPSFKSDRVLPHIPPEEIPHIVLDKGSGATPSHSQFETRPSFASKTRVGSKRTDTRPTRGPEPKRPFIGVPAQETSRRKRSDTPKPEDLPPNAGTANRLLPQRGINDIDTYLGRPRGLQDVQALPGTKMGYYSEFADMLAGELGQNTLKEIWVGPIAFGVQYNFDEEQLKRFEKNAINKFLQDTFPERLKDATDKFDALLAEYEAVSASYPGGFRGEMKSAGGGSSSNISEEYSQFDHNPSGDDGDDQDSDSEGTVYYSDKGDTDDDDEDEDDDGNIFGIQRIPSSRIAPEMVEVKKEKLPRGSTPVKRERRRKPKSEDSKSGIITGPGTKAIPILITELGEALEDIKNLVADASTGSGSGSGRKPFVKQEDGKTAPTAPSPSPYTSDSASKISTPLSKEEILQSLLMSGSEAAGAFAATFGANDLFTTAPKPTLWNGYEDAEFLKYFTPVAKSGIQNAEGDIQRMYARQGIPLFDLISHQGVRKMFAILASKHIESSKSERSTAFLTKNRANTIANSLEMARRAFSGIRYNASRQLVLGETSRLPWKQPITGRVLPQTRAYRPPNQPYFPSLDGYGYNY